MLLTFLSSGALAQQVDAANPASMEQPSAGDHWVYEVHDEVTGKMVGKRTDIITDVTETDIALRRVSENGRAANYVYDKSWNVKSGDTVKYTPNDGRGVKLPLALGATWPIQSDEVNSDSGQIWKFSGHSKVVSRENVATKAGSFDAFKVESTFAVTLTADPIRKVDVTMVTWYVPAIDHWAKRTYATRSNKLLRSNETRELVEYGRK